ncbi:MAG: transaldolase [Marmoricola sp.]
MSEQNENLAALSAAGVSVWLDDLSRERLRSGNLAELIATRSVVGVTTNPTIFAGALAKGEAYDVQVRELVAAGADVDAAARALTTDDVRDACDVFRDVHDATAGKDGRVSIEVDPRLARQTEKTAAQAVELWELVDRPNAMIKIPANEAGLPAITRTLAAGISVNVTLIFSVERYRAVMDAFLDGLEQARANGHDLATIGSVASFFVSRVDTEVDKRLDAIGTPEAVELKSTAALANARLAYDAYEQVFSVGPRWKELAAAGAQAQRPLWASTGVKDPTLPGTYYVTGLVAPNTVNTMPEKTLAAVAEHGGIDGDTVSGTSQAAQEVFDALSGVGIDVTDVFLTLEDEGVQKFEASWGELAETVQGQLDAARG